MGGAERGPRSGAERSCEAERLGRWGGRNEGRGPVQNEVAKLGGWEDGRCGTRDEGRGPRSEIRFNDALLDYARFTTS